MADFLTFGAAKLQMFLLVLLRASGLFLVAPILSNKTVSVPVRVAVAAVLSLLIASTIDPATVPVAGSLVELAALAARETLVGGVIGLWFALIFYAVQSAGAIIGYQIGFAIANFLDPVTQNQVSIMGEFWFLIASMVFLAINGHHLIIQAFYDSFELIPAGQAALNGGAGELLIQYSGYVFVLAVKLAAPVIVCLFLTDVALGTVSKMMPTMNVFIMGIPIKVGMGLLVLGLSLPVFSYVLRKATFYLDHELGLLLAAMGKV